MPRQRIQTDLGVSAPQLRPAARSIDTFIAPNASGSQAAQLAQALSGLAPALARFGQAQFERQSAEDKAEGATKARETVRQLDESRQSYAEAVKKGLIPAIKNPWAKQGYYEELGRVYANRFNSELIAGIESDDKLQDSVEIEDFRSFASTFEKSWFESNIPAEVRNGAFEVGYGNRRDAYLANAETGWAAAANDKFTKRSLGMFRDGAIQFVQEALDQSRNPAEIGATLRQMWDDRRALGWTGPESGQALVDAVAAVAVNRKDPLLMEQVLSAVPGGDGKGKANLKNTAYALDAIEKTEGAIFTARRRDQERQERERTLEIRGIATTAAKRFEEAQGKGADPDDVQIDDLQQRALDLGDVELSTHIQTMKNAYSNQEYDDDNDLVAGFMQKLYQAPGALKQSELDKALAGKRLSLSTYNSLSSKLQTQNETGSGRKAWLKDDPSHEYGIDTVKAYFTTTPDADTPAVAFRKIQAQRQFSEWYYQNFVAEGAPNKALSGRAKKLMIDEQATDLANLWVKYDDFQGGTYRLNASGLDWKGRAVDSPTRITPLLNELSALIGGSESRPSPALVSLLTINGVNIESADEMREFLARQRNFLKKAKP